MDHEPWSNPRSYEPEPLPGMFETRREAIRVIGGWLLCTGILCVLVGILWLGIEGIVKLATH